MNSNLLKNALISEKSFNAVAKDKFTFVVDKSASKGEVAELVAELFDVEVLGVNMISMKGKVKKTRKGSGKRSDFKKAILTLKKGAKIDLFEVEKEDARDKGKNDKKLDKHDHSDQGAKDTKVVVREKKVNAPRKVI